MVLTDKQQHELHQSILGYMSRKNFAKSAAAFSIEGSVEFKSEEERNGFGEALEKKWTSIIRLQRKIMELELQNKQLREDLEIAQMNQGNGGAAGLSLINGGKNSEKNSVEALPRAPPKFSLLGHREPVTKIVFHPVYNILASASEDSTIKIWDYETGKHERTLVGHQDSVQDLDFAQNGSLLASCSADLSIKIWNFESSFECTKTLLGHDHNVSGVRFVHPNPDFIISCSRDKLIKLWELATGFCIRTYSGHDGWVRSISIDPISSMIASASSDHTIRLWNFKTTECLKVLRDHEHVVETIAFSHEKADKYIIKALSQNDNPNNMLGRSPLPSPTAGSMGLNLNGIFPSDSNLNRNSTISSSIITQSTISSGQYLLSGSRDKTIKLWEIQTGICITTINGHDNWVRSVLFHPSGRFFLSCSDDRSIRICDFQRGFKFFKVLSDAHTQFITHIAYSRNNSAPVLASSSVDHSINVYECKAVGQSLAYNPNPSSSPP